MNIGDIVIVKENADWSPDFKQERKFIVLDLTNHENFDYILKTYDWPDSLRNEVFNNSNDYVLITEEDVQDLIKLDKPLVISKPLKKLEIQ